MFVFAFSRYVFVCVIVCVCACGAGREREREREREFDVQHLQASGVMCNLTVIVCDVVYCCSITDSLESLDAGKLPSL